MLRIGHIIGSRLEPAYSEKLQRLELRNAVDELRLSPDHLDKRELTATTRGGQEVAIALPRHERLFDGAVLLLDDNSAVVVRAAGQRWLRLQPRSISDAIELGYHIGTRHSLSLSLDQGRSPDLKLNSETTDNLRLRYGLKF